MIAIIIKCYLVMLVSIGVGLSSILFLGLILIFRKTNPPQTAKKSKQTEVDPLINDLSAIAGDDVFSTQLDLARAYIEADKKNLAKNILEYVLQQGNSTQQKTAQELLHSI